MKLEYGFKRDRPPYECLWHKVAKDDSYKEYKTFDEQSKCKACSGFNESCKAYTPIVKVLEIDGTLENNLEE